MASSIELEEPTLASRIPTWFLDNCIKTPSELRKQSNRVIIQDSTDPHKTTAAPKSKDLFPATYILDSYIFQNFQDIVLQTRKSGMPDEAKFPVPVTEIGFANDSILLRLPGENNGGQEFLTAVVGQLAMHIEADIISLGIEDIKDLEEHIQANQSTWAQEKTRADGHTSVSIIDGPCNCDIGSSDPTSRERSGIQQGVGLIETSGHEDQEQRFESSDDNEAAGLGDTPEQDDENQDDGASESLNQHQEIDETDSLDTSEDQASEDEDDWQRKYMLLAEIVHSSQAAKSLVSMNPEGTSVEERPRLLIIHLSDISNFIEENRHRYKCLLKCLRNVSRSKSIQGTRITAIATDETSRGKETCPCCIQKDMDILKALGSRPLKKPFRVFPVKSTAQESLFYSDKEGRLARQNIRKLQRVVRKLQAETQWASSNSASILLQPYADWEFSYRGDSANFLKQKLLPDDELQSIAQIITRNLTNEHIYSVIGRIGRQNVGADMWIKGGEHRRSNWKSRLSPQARKAVEKIEQDPEKFEWELKILDAIVDPDSIHENWSDIEIDPDVKLRLTQMISLASSNLDNGYGILRNNRIGGALLYGPPGVGKTQLARVLAKTSPAIMLQASSADVESKWVGETEKYINALFAMGKIMSPCIIFIDEADSLFRARSTYDTGWERSRKNQFLAGADGLSRGPNSPFLILATNYPTELDEAALRRVPARLFLGLPLKEARKKLFSMFLRDESLDSSVDLEVLATVTQRYTGSDIKTMCIQAALICESGLIDTKTKRQLRMTHFEKAFRSSSPTVSIHEMERMKEFAEKFDYSAMTAILRDSEHPPLHRVRLAMLATATGRSASRANDAGPISAEQVRVNLYKPQTAPESHENVLDRIPDNSVSPVASLVPSPINVVVPLAYEALSETHPEIRLLEIVNSGSTGSQIECVLRKVFLSEKIKFTALSYVWGSSFKMGEILLNGKLTPVTLNLANALRWAKHHWQKKFPDRDADEFRLWVDAVCINQDDTEERNHQVRLMRDIYSKAELVLSAVACNNSSIAVSFRVYQDIYDVLVNSEPRFSSEELYDYQWLKRLPSLCAEDNKTDQPHNESWAALTAFQTLSYWKRVWIVQEVALAQSVLLICDEASMDFEKLVEISSILSLPKARSDSPLRSVKPEFVPDEVWCIGCLNQLTNPTQFSMILSLRKDRGNMSRHQIMFRDLYESQYIALEATDPRDHVYGLLGLTELDVGPDYNKPVGQVYLEFMKAALKVKILRLMRCGHFTNISEYNFLRNSGVGLRSSDLSIPSWIPNFSTNLPRGSLTPSTQSTWSASLGDLPDLREQPPVTSNHSLLLTGTYIETVIKVTSTYEYPEDHIEATKLADSPRGQKLSQDLLDLIRTYILQYSKYGTDMPVLQSIYRILAMETSPLDSGLLTEGVTFLVDLLCTRRYGFDSDTINRTLDPGFRLTFDPNNLEDSLNWILRNVFPGQESYFDRSMFDKIMNDDTRMGTNYAHRSNRFFQTQGGYLGLGPWGMIKGDLICVLRGCDFPIILRRNEDRYVHVGTCFVLGLMDNEAAELLANGKIKLEGFEIC